MQGAHAAYEALPPHPAGRGHSRDFASIIDSSIAHLRTRANTPATWSLPERQPWRTGVDPIRILPHKTAQKLLGFTGFSGTAISIGKHRIQKYHIYGL